MARCLRWVFWLSFSPTTPTRMYTYIHTSGGTHPQNTHNTALELYSRYYYFIESLPTTLFISKEFVLALIVSPYSLVGSIMAHHLPMGLTRIKRADTVVHVYYRLLYIYIDNSFDEESHCRRLPTPAFLYIFILI